MNAYFMPYYWNSSHSSSSSFTWLSTSTDCFLFIKMDPGAGGLAIFKFLSEAPFVDWLVRVVLFDGFKFSFIFSPGFNVYISDGAEVIWIKKK